MRRVLRGEAVQWPELSAEREVRFLICVERQGISGLLHNAIREQRCTRVPAETEHALAGATRSTAALNMARAESARRVFSAFESARIRSTALKGLAMLAVGYEHAGLRPMSDTDILVSPNEMETAAQALLDLGYKMAPIDTPAVAHHWTFTRADPLEVVDVIELHRQLFVEAPYDTAISADDVLSRRTLVRWRPDGWGPTVSADATSEVYIPVPSLADSLLHAAGHLVIQHAGGERLIWVSDVDRLVRRGSLVDSFWTDLDLGARASGLERPLAEALHAAVEWFGTDLPLPAGILSSRLPTESRRVTDTAATGAPPRTVPAPEPRLQRAGRPSGARAWSDVAASTTWRRRLELARGHMFPAPTDMRAWYGIETWQLPYYYLRRWLRGARDVIVDRRRDPVPLRGPDRWFIED